MSTCPCGSENPFSDCCQPFLCGNKTPQTPEQLMRSRFSAFVTHHWPYVLQTWHPDQRPDCTVQELENEAANGRWLTLSVLHSRMDEDGLHGEVDFCAWFNDAKGLHLHHELSSFVREQGQWFYTRGRFLPAPAALRLKPNNPCPCGSGRKYKKCCGGATKG